VKIELRPGTGVVLLLVVVLCVAAASVVTGQDERGGGDGGSDVDTVTLEDGSEFWPYTSRERDVGTRTLPINLVVYGNPELTEAMLRHSTIGDWEDLEDDRQDVAPAEGVDGGSNATAPTVAWGGADGATRWTYVENTTEGGTWLSEAYQLHDGDFLGDRHHVRAYVDPDGEDWTAMQAHREHWDWFHVRHTVHGVEDSQTHVETEFLERPYIAELHRDRFGNGGADADGWVTVVSVDAPVPYLFGLFVLGSFGAVGRAEARERLAGLYTDETVRRAARSALVVGSLVAWYAGVRFGALWIERSFPELNPWLLVYAFYPVLVVGMPLVAYLTSRQLGAVRAFTAGALGFTLAALLDYTYLGIAVLPIETIVHRSALAVAIGFVAAGASRTARSPDVHSGHVRTGALLWLVVVAIPFLQFV